MSAVSDVAIIGAGPYGLSVAAHLRSRGADFRVFGTPLSTWRFGMPRGMSLKSDGFASSLSAPDPNSSLAAYCREHALPYHPTDIPVAVENFVAYGLDFQRRFVPDVEERTVLSVTRKGRAFRLVLDDGEELDARRVVVAAGITHFAVMPTVFADTPPDLVTHSSAHHDLDGFAGQRVAVIGAGSSAVDLAVLLAAAGAVTTVIARGPEIRFTSAPTGKSQTFVDHVAHPSSGLGPGWRSRLSCDLPDLFRYIPARYRPEIVRRHLGPSSPWRLKAPFEATVDTITNHSIKGVDTSDGVVRLQLRDGGTGGTTTHEADRVICATGYRADVGRLTFLSPSIVADLKTVADAPALSHTFESSVSDLYFVGIAAAVSFGPLMRFMYGDSFAAPRISGHLVKGRG